MTSDQQARWIDFARRLVAHASSYRTPHRRRAMELLTDFLDCYVYDGPDDAPTDWTGWDNHGGRNGHLCDAVDTFLWERKPRWCTEQYWSGDAAADDDTEEERFDQWRDSPATSLFVCAIRAGIDVVCEPSAGVVGFTVGDLRRMYPAELPPWLVEGFESADGSALVDAPDAMGVWL